MKKEIFKLEIKHKTNTAQSYNRKRLLQNNTARIKEYKPMKRQSRHKLTILRCMTGRFQWTVSMSLFTPNGKMSVDD